MSSRFYEIAEQLDKLKGLEEPSQKDVEMLAEYITGPEYSRYFFKELESLAWVKPLHSEGWFDEAPPPKESEDKPGYFSMPAWPEGEYLKGAAEHYPDVIVDVALGLETHNARAISVMLDALSRVPVEHLRAALPALGRWVDTPFVRFMDLSRGLGLLMERLAQEGEVGAALRVLEILTAPTEMEDSVWEERIVAGTKFEFYWLGQVLDKNFSALVAADAIEVLQVLEGQLLRAVDMETSSRDGDKEGSLGSYWRLNIDPGVDANARKDLKNLLVDAMIKALDHGCASKRDETERILGNYVDHEQTILRRIAAFVLRKRGARFPALLEEAYRGLEGQPGLEHEARKLAEAQLIEFPQSFQDEFLQSIRRGPDEERVEAQVEKHPDALEGQTKADKRRYLIEQWQLRRLHEIKEHLQGEDKERYYTLREKYGEPEAIPEIGAVSVSWSGPKSPIDKNELGKLPVAEVVDRLAAFGREDESSEVSREGLGRVLEQDIKSRPNEYVESALLFAREDVPSVFHAHYFRGLIEAIRSRDTSLSTRVMQLCEHVVGKTEENIPKQEFEPGLREAKLEIARLVNDLLGRGEQEQLEVLLKRTEELLRALLAEGDPSGEEFTDATLDAAARSINNIRGLAMHGVVKYGLYLASESEEEDARRSGRVSPFVMEQLDARLDKSLEPSPSVHAVYGWYFPQLVYLNQDWAGQNIGRIFPTGDDARKYHAAAWNAYIRFSDVYEDVFPLLIPQYRRALKEADWRQDGGLGDRADEKLASHILKAYLMELIELDSDDKLVDLYFRTSRDEVRAQGNSWLSKVLHAQKPSEDDVTWQRTWKMWKGRVKEASAAKVKSNYKEEMTSYYRLLEHVPVGLDVMSDTLGSMLEFNPGEYEVQLIIAYLGKHCTDYPRLAISGLHRILNAHESFYMTKDTKEYVRNILEAGLSGGQESKALATDIVNLFGERGDYQWRPLLNAID